MYEFSQLSFLQYCGSHKKAISEEINKYGGKPPSCQACLTFLSKLKWASPIVGTAWVPLLHGKQW